MNLAHAGVGSASKAPVTAISIRGTAPIMTEMIAGRVDLTCDQTTNALPFVQDGRVRAFAVTTAPGILARDDGDRRDRRDGPHEQP